MVMSDNGPQFSSQEFAEFATRYHFKHITSSPLYPTSNGQAERSVQTVKHLLRNAEDPFLALLAYRATPMPWCGKSPAELLMARSLRSTVPQRNDQLVPSWPYLQDFRACNTQRKARQKAHYDRTHRVRELPVLPDGTNVWVTSNGNPTPGQTVTTTDAPRLYIVQTPTGEARRNRRHHSTKTASFQECPILHTPCVQPVDKFVK